MGREDLAVAVDDGEQVVEIVGHAAGQPADRIESLGVDESFLQPPLLGQVTKGGDDMRHLPGFIEQRIVTPRRVERAPVGADEETFAGQRLPRAMVGEPPAQAHEFGLVAMKPAGSLADEVDVRVAGHRAETLVGEDDPESLRAPLPRGDEHALALGLQRGREDLL